MDIQGKSVGIGNAKVATRNKKGGCMTPRRTTKRPPRVYSRSGINTLKGAVKALGARAIDKRTSMGKAISRWRSELVQDLGGPEAISTQQQVVIDLAVKGKLILDSVDNWLLQQPSLINLRRRALLPVVTQRQQLADGLLRALEKLGLERKAKPVKSLAAHIEEKYGASLP